MKIGAIDPVLAAVAEFYSLVVQAKAAGELEYPTLQKEHLMAWGCPYIDGDVVKYTALLENDKTSFADEIPAILVDVVAHLPNNAMGLSSLMGGLARSGCWRACLRTIEGAHALAVAICYFIDTLEESARLDKDVESDVLEIINAWLEPRRPWSKIPPVIAVATALFGSWWCDLALDDIVQGPPGQCHWEDVNFTAHVIAKDRPPFLPGLCPIQIDAELEHLPDMGISL
jgi:hypothetical protein